MITLRPSTARGHLNHGWLDTYHTFSFGDYQDPDHQPYRALRVINEDWIQPGQGFGTHPHRDMEILTWVLEGALEHADSTGGGGVIRPGELQRMSAGRGILHSEFNASSTEPVHLLQIWILPEAKGLEPRYGQKPFPAEARHNRWQLLASRDGREGSLDIHQEAELWVADLQADHRLGCPLDPVQYVWIQVARGRVRLGGHELRAGDAAALRGEPYLALEAEEDAQVLRFTLS